MAMNSENTVNPPLVSKSATLNPCLPSGMRDCITMGSTWSDGITCFFSSHHEHWL